MSRILVGMLVLVVLDVVVNWVGSCVLGSFWTTFVGWIMLLILVGPWVVVVDPWVDGGDQKIVVTAVGARVGTGASPNGSEDVELVVSAGLGDEFDSAGD